VQSGEGGRGEFETWEIEDDQTTGGVLRDSPHISAVLFLINYEQKGISNDNALSFKLLS
jgi:hypothetical protein